VALRLEPASEEPTLEMLADALQRPIRPLFLGRKACLPAGRIFGGTVDGENAVAAIQRTPPIALDPVADPALYFNEPQAAADTDRIHAVSDQRRFSMDVHAGRQRVYERWARS